MVCQRRATLRTWPRSSLLFAETKPSRFTPHFCKKEKSLRTWGIDAVARERISFGGQRSNDTTIPHHMGPSLQQNVEGCTV